MTNYLCRSNLPLTIPRNVAKCPYCDSDLIVVAITETEVEIDCSSYLPHEHCYPYSALILQQNKATQWVRDNFDVCSESL
jgi:hypothetical protein